MASLSLHDREALAREAQFKQATCSSKITRRPKHGSINDDGSDIRGPKNPEALRPEALPQTLIMESAEREYRDAQGDDGDKTFEVMGDTSFSDNVHNTLGEVILKGLGYASEVEADELLTEETHGLVINAGLIRG